jgi:cytochrome c-type biogenesis protein
MEFLQEFISNSEIPLLSAFLLGIMTAISPCPLATNITAIGFISKDLQDRKKVFLNGVFYTLGRTITYTVLGVLLIVIIRQGGSSFKIQQWLSLYGGYVLGPFLILMGLFMFDFIKINFSFTGKNGSKMEERAKSGTIWSSLSIGVVFALAFCPYSGVLYFGGLIPLSVASPEGFLLPVVFAFATGLPVILFAWILAYSVSGIGSVYKKIKTFEFWFRRVVAALFIIVGIYFIYTFYF